MDAVWTELCHAAKAVLNPRRISEMMEACGACREMMTQLMPKTYRDVEIMLNCELGRIVTLGELTPEWWI